MQRPIIGPLKFVETRLIPGVAICLFGFSAVWMLVEALSRQLFERSYAISEELIVFSLLWAILLILPQSGRSGFHIYVDLFINKAGKKKKPIITCITSLLSSVYCIVVAVSAAKFIGHLYRMEIISESPMQLPMWGVCLVIPIGAVLMAIFYLQSAAASILHRKE